jgi:hypothetical protein
MTLDTDQTNARIAGLAVDACVALWQDYGIAITRSAFGSGGSADDPLLFGVIGFVGEGLRATCMLGAHPRLIAASGRSANQPRDWIAELSNQLLGRMKMRLLGCGVSVQLTTPLALSGVRLTPLPRLAQAPLVFESKYGDVLVCLEVETESGFVLPVETPLSVAPGELVF